MKFNTTAIISIIIIIATSLLVSIPLTKQGLFQIHDDQQVARLYLFDKALKDGQFPPRFVAELGFGFGYPLFVFYPPMVYMLGEVIHLFGLGFVDSTKVIFFLSILLSAFSMFYFLRRYLGNLAATFSSIFYIMVPYRAVDVYVRGALSEAFSFVWIPPLILSFLALSERPGKKYAILCAFFTSLLLITHNLIFIAMTALAPVFILLFLDLKNKKSFILYLLMSLTLAAGLSAFFWLPSLAEKSKTLVDQILLTELASYRIHFVYPQQLWNSLWGFGGSAEGLLDGLSFKIGKIHLVLSISACALYLLFKSKNKKNNLLSRSQEKLLALTVSILLVSMFLTTSYSKIVWELYQPLTYLQFPWRFLIFISFSTSVLAGYFIYQLRLGVLKVGTFLILIGVLFYTNLKLFQPQTYRSYFNDEFATSREIINWNVSRSSFEYMPKGVELTKSQLDTTVINITEAEVPLSPITVLQGSPTLGDIKSSSNKVSFLSNSDSQSKIIINKTNFPLWNLTVNSSKVTYTDENKFKLIEFILPAGQNKVELELMNTWPRTLGNFTTIFSLFSLIVIYRWKKID